MPFVAKAVGHPIAKYASLAMAGRTLKEIGLTEEPLPTNHVAVKEVVLPFNKFPGARRSLAQCVALGLLPLIILTSPRSMPCLGNPLSGCEILCRGV